MSFSVCFAAWKRAFCVVNGMIGSYSLLSAHKRGPDTAPGARWLCVIIRQSFEMLLRATFATENCHHPRLLIFQLAISRNLSALFLCSCIIQLTATSCCLSIVLCRKPAACFLISRYILMEWIIFICMGAWMELFGRVDIFVRSKSVASFSIRRWQMASEPRSVQQGSSVSFSSQLRSFSADSPCDGTGLNNPPLSQYIF